MKSQNLNNSSRKTRRLIRKVFAEMLSEKKDLDKLSVSELCTRADICRGTFYSHYDDIYSVAEEYEKELIDTFFDNVRLVNSKNIMQFVDTIFEYFRQNDENYRLLCKSNDLLLGANKLTSIATKKLLELCYNDERIKSRKYVDLDINIFIEGILCEYVKICRGYSEKTLDNLYDFTKYWVTKFIESRSI